MNKILAVSKKICELSNYTTTNLRLQKQLYIAQVLSLGIRKKTLFTEEIQAWKYGPVSPVVYNRFKMFGSHCINAIAFKDVSDQLTKDENEFITAVVDSTKQLEDWQLVGLTHRDGTAWSNTFNNQPFQTISIDAMKQEYACLWSKKNG